MSSTKVQNPGTERKYHRDASVSYTIVAGTDYSTATTKIASLGANFQIVLQRIAINVTTDNAATQLFQDSAGTPIIAAGTKASPGIGPILFDFGDDGFALTAGKDFQHKMSGAGLAASITVQAYQRTVPDLAAGITPNVAGTRGFSV